MGIYRSDMALFTYGPEDNLGGYKETTTLVNGTKLLGNTTNKSGDNIIKLSSTGFNSANFNALDAGSYILIGTSHKELRRVINTDASEREIFLDYPLGYTRTTSSSVYHKDSGLSSSGTAPCQYIIGAYETVTAPDVQPEFMERYFLNQHGDRNWTYMYRGRESLNGSVSNVIMLDARPLTYILGGVSHSVEGSGIYDNHYIHYIYGSDLPPSMTWDILLRDSSVPNYTPGSAVNDYSFLRRYIGGVVNRGTISLNEGEVVQVGWDDVLFMDLIHNQSNSGSLNGNVDRSNRYLIQAKAPNASSGGIDYPDTQPYYFSSGTLKFYDQEFARVRSARIEINNNIEPRYYIRSNQGKRGPSEFQAQQRQITMSLTVAMDDAILHNSNSTTLWKEFILQGNYQGIGNTPLLEGFNMELILRRGNNDYVAITSPNVGSSAFTTPSAPSATDNPSQYKLTSSEINSNFGNQGCFFRRVSHNLGQQNPIQVDGELIMRNLGIKVMDKIAPAGTLGNVPTYPFN